MAPGIHQVHADLPASASSTGYSSVVNPVHVGNISNSNLIGADSVFVSGKYAYVASFASKSLEIVDVSNPTSPVHKGSIGNGSIVKLDHPYNVFVSGNYVYLASYYDNALEVVDVSNPSSPVHKGSIITGGNTKLDGAMGVFVSGKYAYLAGYGDDALEIVDVSNPPAPTHTGSLSTGGPVKLDGAVSVFVSGNYAYVASYYDDALEIVNISDPAVPVHAWSISNGSEVRLNGPRSVFVSGNYAYVASYNDNALEIVDVSNPAAPTHKGSISDGSEVRLNGPRSVFVSGNYAYVASYNDNALEIVDVSNPAAPTHKGSISDGGVVKLNGSRSVFVSGNYAYVTGDNSRSLEIVQFINPAYPTVTSITPITAPNTETAKKVTLTGFNFKSGIVVNLTNATISIPGTVSSMDSTIISCSFPLTGAPTGTYAVNLLNPEGGAGTLCDTFTVTNATPTITTLTPVTGFNSGTLPVTITGTAFRNGATVTLVKGSTTIPGPISSRTTTHILCSFPLNGTAPGSYNLTVLNTDGLSVTKMNAFTLQQTGSYPMIAAFTPTSGLNTAALPFTIVGANFRTGATVTITNGTTNKTVAGTLTGTAKITCSLPLTGLQVGLYNLTVRNTDGSTVTQENVFTVTAPAPTITILTPVSGYNTGSLPVVIAGTKFVTGCQVELVNGGTVIPGAISLCTATKITGTFALAGALPGIYNLTVTNPGGPNATKPFTILSPGSDPAIANVTPTYGVNTGSLPFTINGANLRAGITVTITNGTMFKTVTGTVTGSTQVKCSLPLTGLPIGLYNLTLRNADGTNATQQNIFTIMNPAPVISTLTPASGYSSGAVPVTISGSKFVSGIQALLSNGGTTIPGLISSCTSTKIVSIFNLTGAPAGVYYLNLTNPDDSCTTKANSFTILSPGPAPTITGFGPQSGVNTAVLPFTIIGTNYRAGASVSIFNGSNSKTVAASSVSSTMITCSLPLTGLPIGLYNLTVRNTDGSSVTQQDAFTVFNPAPTIASLNPVSGYNTSTILVTITGTRFATGATIVLVNNSTEVPGTVVIALWNQYLRFLPPGRSLTRQVQPDGQ